jgi:hypothetical protein
MVVMNGGPTSLSVHNLITPWADESKKVDDGIGANLKIPVTLLTRGRSHDILEGVVKDHIFCCQG